MPFTAAAFFDVFRRYNEAVWPLQFLLVAAGLVVVLPAVRPRPNTGRLGMQVVAMLWLWMAVVYHLAFFRQVNPAATIFGALFLVQAGLFAWLGVRENHIAFHARRDAAGVTGGLLVVYALVLYPVVGLLAGHRYPNTPTFGLPCPTTILTFGLLLWAELPVPRVALIIPLLWAGIGTVGAVQFGVPQDWGLTLAAMIATPIMLLSRRHHTPATAT